VKDSAQELAGRIEEIVTETGCGKVNIIAHSKGGSMCVTPSAASGRTGMWRP
jgi:triacylglycerol lipase